MDFIKEWILDLILDSLKGTAAEKIGKAEWDKRFADFMNRQFKDLERSNLDDNYDYSGLLDYITESLGDELQTYLSGLPEERTRAKKAILLKGVAYALNKKKYPVEKVKKVLNTILDIVYKFMKEQAELRGLFTNVLKQKQENLAIAEEAVAGKKLLFRYIFLYKNEENRILYLRAAALLKDE